MGQDALRKEAWSNQIDQSYTRVQSDMVVSGVEPQRQGWKVLVVDQDARVHVKAQMAVAGLGVLGHGVQVEHATSVEAALAILAQQDDIAVVLADTGSGFGQIGPKLARRIRQAGNADVQIVLRTSGTSVPPTAVFERCDIAAYVTRDEIGEPRFVIVLSAAIRAYQKIREAAAGTGRFDLLAAAGDALAAQADVFSLARAALAQAANILGRAADGFAYAETPHPSGVGRQAGVVGATGRFDAIYLRGLDRLDGDMALNRLNAVMRESEGLAHADGVAVLRIDGPHSARLLIYVEHGGELDPTEQALLRNYAADLGGHFRAVCETMKWQSTAFVDGETGIANADYLRNRIDALAADHGGDCRLALVRLLNFNAIVETFGYTLALRLLAAVVGRLRAVCSAAAVIARFHDDTFGVLDRTDDLDPQAIVGAFDDGFTIDDRKLQVTPVVGYVDLWELVGGADTVIPAAVAALTEAGRMGPSATAGVERAGTAVAFAPALLTAIGDRGRMVADLNRALEADALSAVLQPKVTLADGSVAGSEVLARWLHEDDFIAPDVFVPIAEAAGLLPHLTRSVLRQIGRYKTTRRQAGRAPSRFAINLSAAELRGPGMPHRLLDDIVDAGMAPADVEIEVSESVLLDDAVRIMRVLSGLKAAGCAVALDNFGAGQSSLIHLEELKPDRLKIDRRFVEPLNVDNARSSVAALIVELGRHLSIPVLAAGVETAAHHVLLRLLGCDGGQGYLYARPMPAPEFDQWCEQRQTVH